MQRPKIEVVTGGRRKLEEELVAEFLKPGVGNLRKIKRLGKSLRPRGQLRGVPSTSEPLEKADR